MDSIILQNISVQTRIGVPAAERVKEQELMISLELFHPLSGVAKTDNVTHGIDYAAVTQEVVTLAKDERKTIERFAEDIAGNLLKKFKPEGGVKITVMKKPMLPLDSASVTILRP